MNPTFIWILPALITLLFAGDPLNAKEPKTDFEQKVEQSILVAVHYLAQEQKASGGWVVDQYQGETTSATSLAVMAMLAAGYVPGEQPYGEHIRKGVQFVLDHQEPNGMLIHKRGHGPMYCHGISTLMLADVCGTLEEPQATQCKKALERAIKLILDAQNVFKPQNQRGGWRYQTTSNDSDLSVTAWQLLAIRGAKNIGCDIPAEPIDRAVDYVKRCSTRNFSGFGYQPGGGPTPVLTGTGITALQVCGEYEAPEVEGGAKILLRRPPRFDETYYFYGLYYSSVGMYQVGGDTWNDFKVGVWTELMSRQSHDGSWLASNGSERPFGRVYCTSLGVLALSVDYGYLPIYQR